jgi:hypothetical protein
MIKVSLNQEYGALPSFRQRRCKVQRNCGFSVLRQRAGDQKTLQLSRVPKFSQTHSQEPKPVGPCTARIGMQDDAAVRVHVHLFRWYLLKRKGRLHYFD